MACISDVAIADINTKFAMPETRLGIVPAQIAPFVVSRIGLMQTRRLTLLGEAIYGEEAKALGFVHYVTQNKDVFGTSYNNNAYSAFIFHFFNNRHKFFN